MPLRALYSQTFLWADVRRNLHRVDQPLLVYQSIHDHADPSSVPLIKAGVRSSDQTYVELQRSYHVATLDYEADISSTEALRSSDDSRRRPMVLPSEDDRDAIDRAFAELVAGYHLTADPPDAHE